MNVSSAKDWSWQKRLRWLLAKGIVWLTAIILFLIASLILWYALHIFTLPSTAQVQDIGANRLVEAASLHIREFQTANHRLPFLQEFQKWKDVADDHEGGGAAYSTGPFSDSEKRIFGSPPSDAYTLSFWDDGVVVTYASWFGNGSKVYVPDSGYFSYGSRSADVAVYGLLGIVALLLATFWAVRMTDFEMKW